MVMDAVDKCIELLLEYKKTNKRETAVDALHMLDKFLDGVLFSINNGGHKKTCYTINCKDCGKQLTARTTKKEFCNSCLNKRKIARHKEIIKLKKGKI